MTKTTRKTANRRQQQRARSRYEGAVIIDAVVVNEGPAPRKKAKSRIVKGADVARHATGHQAANAYGAVAAIHADNGPRMNIVA